MVFLFVAGVGQVDRTQHQRAERCLEISDVCPDDSPSERSREDRYDRHVDTLGTVLATAAVEGSVAASLRAGDLWGLRLAAVPGAAFHAVTAGTAILTVEDRPPLRLMPGDAVLLPFGDDHVLASGTDASVRDFDHVRAEAAIADGVEIVVGDGPASTRVICASYRVDPAATVTPFAGLPRVLHVPALSAPPALRSSLLLMADELASPGPGVRAVLDHIVNVVLIQMLRVWIEDPGHPVGPPSWLRGLADPVTSRALGELHRDPAHPWTVAALARRVGVSRATLARRFESEVGRPPGDYVTAWRMELAAHHLRRGTEPVGVVARAVGYQSEYAFNRAFARYHGSPPGRFRSAARS
jgi:AraC-like DNA-binding protein